MTWLASRRGVAILSALALMAFLARSWLDWGFVYPEFVPETDRASITISLAFYLAVTGAWLWALSASARDSRRGLWALFGLALLLVVGGVATPVALCAFPCQTAWPLMEVSNWSGLVLGILAGASAWLRLRQPAGAPAG